LGLNFSFEESVVVFDLIVALALMLWGLVLPIYRPELGYLTFFGLGFFVIILLVVTKYSFEFSRTGLRAKPVPKVQEIPLEIKPKEAPNLENSEGKK